MPNTINIDKGDLELNFPNPEMPLKEPPCSQLSWEQWMMETADRTRYFLLHHDSREQRKRDPNEERFVL